VTEKPIAAVELGAVAEISLGGEKQTVLIAGARDHHFPKEGEVLPIPYNSPLGTVLIDHRAGDRFMAQINGNQQTIAIERVSRPTLFDILNIFPVLREQAP
jgi:transcription elongation GreA/GreB family factor